MLYSTDESQRVVMGDDLEVRRNKWSLKIYKKNGVETNPGLQMEVKIQRLMDYTQEKMKERRIAREK